MFAISLDEEKYIKSYSDKFRNPESILVESIPKTSDSEKMRCYQYINEEFVLDADKWAKIEAKRAESARIRGIETKIDSLKNQISASDYQIIKCYEYALNNLELPYDAQALHEERQKLRDQINILEKHLKVEE